MIVSNRPLCKACARYAGKSDHMRNGVYCVHCRVTMRDTTLRPIRGGRAKHVLPCSDYIPKQTTNLMMVI